MNYELNCIVAADTNWGIGYRGNLLVSIPADHKMFRRQTMGKIVVYGRKTLETFPLAQPLDGRENIILSRNPDFHVRGAEVVHSLPQLLEGVLPRGKDVYVIGGDSVYHQLLPYCSTAYVTRLDYSYAADAYFPNLDEDPEWEIAEESDEQTYFDIAYEFVRYERKK